MSYLQCVFIVIFVLFVYLLEAKAEYMNMTIPLNKTTSYNNKELHGEYVTLKGLSTLQVNFERLNKDISFIIFQVHSHIYSLTMHNSTNPHVLLNGTNVGLYSAVEPEVETFFVKNPQNFNVFIYLSVHGYNDRDPVPGGCNQEWSVYIAPYLEISLHQKDYITVDAAAALNKNDTSCNTFASVVFYRMYLPEKTFDSKTYFQALRNMMTLDKILDFGVEIPRSSYQWEMRRMLSAYPGTGSIYVAVAYLDDIASKTSYNAVYVPTHTYVCSPDNVAECEMLGDLFSRILCALLFFLGIFICYLGHRFFKTGMFINISLGGFIVTYIVLLLTVDTFRSIALSVSICNGIIVGGLWLFFWYFYGVPAVALTLSALNMGFFCASFVYFVIPGGILMLESDTTFWILFILIMISVAVFLISITVTSNIICCAILGGYAVIYPIDSYIGTNLRYIIINIVRRALVKNFNKAVIEPPIQWKDILVAIIWVALLMSGIVVQLYYSSGRPPVPPAPQLLQRPRPSVPEYGRDNRTIRFGSDVASRLSIPRAEPSDIDERSPLLA